MSEEVNRDCPFCGAGEPEDSSINGFVYCRRCSASVRLEDWQKRPVEDSLRLKLTSLEKELESERIAHRAWTTLFGTTQLTHAIARVEAAEKERDRLTEQVEDFWAAMAEAKRLIACGMPGDAEALLETSLGPCGDCGDDGEDPSPDCPTCKGSGFKSPPTKTGTGGADAEL